MQVATYFQWADKSVTYRIINWSDRNAVRDFAATAHGCLSKGGTVVTRLATGDMAQHEDMCHADMCKALTEMVSEIKWISEIECH